MAGLALAPAQAQNWTALVNQPSFDAGTAILLTDGTVMVQSIGSGGGSGAWYLLTPDADGGYVGGTWTQMASMPSGYAPLYYASAVLPDGRVLVEGGEYNGSGTQAETNLGAIFDPVTGTWTAVNPPPGWSEIGDGQSAVLPNGTLMLGNCCSALQALFDESSLSWSPTGQGKADVNTEEGWVLLPDGDVLTVGLAASPGTTSELYNPVTGEWAASGTIPLALENQGCYETGPMVLRPDGTVFAIGGTGNTDVYTPSSGTWAAGPVVPGGYGVDDGPAALLPSGDVLFQTSLLSATNCYSAPSEFWIFNGTSLSQAPPTPDAGTERSFEGRMLVLPTGQVLYTDGTEDIEVFTPAGTYQAAWQPTITSVAATLDPGSTDNDITGTQFGGLSQGGMYGDDAQMATNYPLVRITDDFTQHVFYCRTHDFSSMGVATGSETVSAEFDVPPNVEYGASTIEVVTNGIPSNPVAVQVGEQSAALAPASMTFKAGIGFSSTEKTCLTNNGPGRLTLEGTSGPSGLFFSLSATTCQSTLPDGQSCSYSITFAPRECIEGGETKGEFYVRDSAASSPQEVALTGIGTRCALPSAPDAGGSGGGGSGPSPASGSSSNGGSGGGR